MPTVYAAWSDGQMKRLEGKRILVTGAASGIGQATALRLLDEGAKVVAADIAADGLDKTRAQADEAATGERLTTLEMNVGDERSVVEGVRSSVEQLGGFSYVYASPGPAEITVQQKGHSAIPGGAEVSFGLDPAACLLFDGEGKRV